MLPLLPTLYHIFNYIYYDNAHFGIGPKPEEVSIFWQMIWEQKPAVVVMLTNVVENGKVRCALQPIVQS